MKLIALTKGLFAKVDDQDFEFLNQWRWRAEQRHGREFYAVRYRHAPGNRQKRVSMARLLMGEPKGFLVDHWNGDTLDNQRENLRKATNAQNQCNQRRLRVNNTTGFKGVYLDKPRGRYVAQIYLNQKRKYLGYFETAEEAARAYDTAAVAMFGEFAAPNTVML